MDFATAALASPAHVPRSASLEEDTCIEDAIPEAADAAPPSHDAADELQLGAYEFPAPHLYSKPCGKCFRENATLQESSSEDTSSSGHTEAAD